MKSNYDIIRRPIITEKATLASEFGGVVFEVSMESNKAEIKQAIEDLGQGLGEGVGANLNYGGSSGVDGAKENSERDSDSVAADSVDDESDSKGRS